MCVPTCVKHVRHPHDNTLEPIHCMAPLAPREKLTLLQDSLKQNVSANHVRAEMCQACPTSLLRYLGTCIHFVFSTPKQSNAPKQSPNSPQSVRLPQTVPRQSVSSPQTVQPPKTVRQQSAALSATVRRPLLPLNVRARSAPPCPLNRARPGVGGVMENSGAYTRGPPKNLAGTKIARPCRGGQKMAPAFWGGLI